MNQINPVLVAIPLVGGLAILAWAAWRRMKDKEARERALRARDAALEAARAQPLPEGSAELYGGSDGRQAAGALAGKLMFVLAGTFAGKLGLRVLAMMDMCGLERAVGSILLIELDEDRRRDFLEQVPAVFHDRIRVASCAALPGGGVNRPLSWIWDKRAYWMSELQSKAREVCDLHQRRSPRSNEAAQVVPFISLGATGYMGATAVREILKIFRIAQCVGFTAYPHHDRLRTRAPEVLQAYIDAGCHGFICADNLPDGLAPHRDFLENDMGMVAIIVGLIAATKNADAVTETNNAFTLVLPDEPGGMASFRTYITTLPAFEHRPHPALDPRYYVMGDAMVSACLRALDEVGQEHRKAVSAEFGHELTSRFDIIVTPLEPLSLLRVQDETLAALKTVNSLKPNYDVFFAGIKTRIDPTKPTCPIFAVSLEAIRDPVHHLASVSRPLIASSIIVPNHAVEPNGSGDGMAQQVHQA